MRKAAEDSSVSLKSLDMSPMTVAKICKMYNIEWKHGLELTEESVREALSGNTTLEAAKLLGCSVQTLHNRFSHLLDKRKSPNFLQNRIQDVYTTSIEKGIAYVARQHDTSRTTITKALKKAGLWDDYQAAIAGKRHSRQDHTE